jgi:hypothetical protein
MKAHEQIHPSFSTLKADKTNGLVAGLFFITATVSAIFGLKLYDPLLVPTDYLATGGQHANQIIAGAIAELVLAVANVGTGIMLYPYLRRFNESMGLGYVCFRVLEVVMILIGVVSMLSLLSLSQHHIQSGATGAGDVQVIGSMLQAAHRWTFIIGPHFMLGVNTAIYSYVFYRTGLVPRKLASLGLIGAVLVFAVSILLLFGIVELMTPEAFLPALPIASYEMILAGWLIIKGFNSAVIKEASRRNAALPQLAMQY